MNRQEERCFLEEELLMHLLDEERPDDSIRISNHIESCSSCRAVFNDFIEVDKAIRSWTIEELPEESWESMKIQLMENAQKDAFLFRGKGMISSVFNIFQPAWSYAIKSPIPAVCSFGIVIAFASESVMEFFRLQHMMPSAGQIIGMLRKIL